VRPITEPGVEFVDIYFPGGETEVWIPMTSNDVQKGTGWASVNISNQAVRIKIRDIKMLEFLLL
jgi:alpha-glucosidase (family GH31 glycosyl hydrolase)